MQHSQSNADSCSICNSIKNEHFSVLAAIFSAVDRLGWLTEIYLVGRMYIDLMNRFDLQTDQQKMQETGLRSVCWLLLSAANPLFIEGWWLLFKNI
jgi:hypothetical protein